MGLFLLLFSFNLYIFSEFRRVRLGVIKSTLFYRIFNESVVIILIPIIFLLYLNGSSWNFKGIYAITPDYLFGIELIKLIERTLDAGINIIQYRFNKIYQKEEVIDTAETLFKKVQAFGAEFIVNNDVNLANDLFTGLHIGPDFKNKEVLDQKNNIKFVGFSCKNSLDPQKNDIHNRFELLLFRPNLFFKTKWVKWYYRYK
mgnify:CR=1 FL=1